MSSDRQSPSRTCETQQRALQPLGAVLAAAGGSNPSTHAWIINRATGFRPSRAAGPLLQLQRHHGNRYVQRVLALANQHGSGPEAEVTPNVEDSIDRARVGGRPLDALARRQMESAFGTNFGGVRIHTGAEANRLNRELSALAFTTGNDIFFRDGEYKPDSSAGRKLLAHELTHVVQQGGAAVKGKLTLGATDDPYEREADSVAREVVEGLEGATAPPVQRKCACGEHAASGGECAECKQKREAVARLAVDAPLRPSGAAISRALQRQPQISRSSGPSPATIFRSESVHPEEQACQDLSENPAATCSAIIQCIEDLIEALAGRFADVQNLGGDEGHWERIVIVQGILKALMAMAQIECKNGEYDPELQEEAEKWANKGKSTGQPQQQPNKTPSTDQQKQTDQAPTTGKPTWEKVVEVVLALGLAIGLVATIVAAIADPEPVTKLALAGLTYEEIMALLSALGIAAQAEGAT